MGSRSVVKVKKKRRIIGNIQTLISIAIDNAMELQQTFRVHFKYIPNHEQLEYLSRNRDLLHVNSYKNSTPPNETPPSQPKSITPVEMCNKKSWYIQTQHQTETPIYPNFNCRWSQLTIILKKRTPCVCRYTVEIERHIERTDEILRENETVNIPQFKKKQDQLKRKHRRDRRWLTRGPCGCNWNNCLLLLQMGSWKGKCLMKRAEKGSEIGWMVRGGKRSKRSGFHRGWWNCGSEIQTPVVGWRGKMRKGDREEEEEEENGKRTILGNLCGMQARAVAKRKEMFFFGKDPRIYGRFVMKMQFISGAAFKQRGHR